jgi:hypothetical protein
MTITTFASPGASAPAPSGSALIAPDRAARENLPGR